ncbi:serine protease [Roseovarius sp. MMSF_3350]|uniref:serine protease n=2 Tax=unclassified Roseovarius TaxID=2614913 RepID=UPI00273D1CA6|nr:serine protease [Roseovarius sp. MMSF_3350]
MSRIFLTLAFLAVTLVAPIAAKAQVFIQIEAQPSLAQAEASLRRYSGRMQDVNGFALGGGWYGIALGPYSEEDANTILRNLRSSRLIPRDSYIAEASEYDRQFWPVGANVLNRPTQEVTDSTATDSATQGAEQQTTTAETLPQPDPEPQPSDETVREARASEAGLTREEREALQEALKWAGFYGGKIDAAFGQGTRGSMARWQEANNFEATGVLTTRQRAELFRQYNAVLEGLDLRVVRDTGAGISMKLPTGVVEFSKYEPPFAHYDATGDIDAKVLLISQAGDRATLAGLYDIMQTLEIVPQDGPRNLDGDSFTLIGENAYTISHTQAWLRDGHIKGFTVVWPAGDEERRTRMLGEMQESFSRLDMVLDPAAGANEVQSIDLVAGLEIRKPKISRSGFYVDRSGTVVTTTEVVASCGRITLDETIEAEVQTVNDETGIAVLRPRTPLAPLGVAAFQQNIPRLQSDVAVAGYSYGGVLGAPSVTFGQLADVRGLNGEQEMKRLALNALEGDAGGPVVDAGGAVVGMLLPARDGSRQLPDGVSFAANAETIRRVLEQAGVTPSATNGNGQMPPESLSERASGMTVLVSCWE